MGGERSLNRIEIDAESSAGANGIRPSSIAATDGQVTTHPEGRTVPSSLLAPRTDADTHPIRKAEQLNTEQHSQVATHAQAKFEQVWIRFWQNGRKALRKQRAREMERAKAMAQSGNMDAAISLEKSKSQRGNALEAEDQPNPHLPMVRVFDVVPDDGFPAHGSGSDSRASSSSYGHLSASAL